MDADDFAAVLLVVAGGAATQRITGLGFALVAAPLLVVALGPHEGVLLANMLSLTCNLIVLAQTWRDVQLRRVLLLAVPALVMVPVGQQVARSLPTAPLMIGIGSVVILALGAVLAFPRTRLFRGRLGAVAAGALSGFMNVTAGVGGPAMTLYAVSSGWTQRRFVGSMQLYFAMLNTGSVIAKGLPRVAPLQLAEIFAALALGLVVGSRAAPHIPGRRARQAVVLLALGGAGATVVKGLLLL